MREPEWFLKKIDDSAEKLRIIGMNCPPELPWLPALKDAGLPVAYTGQGCVQRNRLKYRPDNCRSW